jgi:hypothetical protein
MEEPRGVRTVSGHHALDFIAEVCGSAVLIGIGVGKARLLALREAVLLLAAVLKLGRHERRTQLLVFLCMVSLAT